MLASIRRRFRRDPAPPPAIPAGERVYAIGDVHGRSDLFLQLIQAIEYDNRARGGARTTIVMLGDLIDRGPDSASVIAMARAWKKYRNLRFVLGNHEEVFLQSFQDASVFEKFMRFGGRETIMSYPIDRAAFAEADLGRAQAIMAAAIPDADVEFIADFEDFIVIGGYLFVHAGIRPGQPLTMQDPRVTRWIREPFLSFRGDHGHMVVHGHTISAEPEEHPNRIGLDTGAYLHGRLTAIGLEGEERWILQAQDAENMARPGWLMTET